MKHSFIKGIALAACGACLMMPMSAAANQLVLNDKALYEIRTLTGQFQPGYSDGTASNASLYTPASVLELKDGGLLVSDTDNHLLRLVSDENVTTYSGLILDFDEQGYPIGAFSDGGYNDAFYLRPGGLTQDTQGNIYVADSGNHRIRKLSSDKTVTTIAGTGIIGDTDGPGEQAALYGPSDVAVDSLGNIYVADTLNHTIRKIDTDGMMSTLTKRSARLVEYYPGMVTEAGDYRDGPIAEALFNEPTALAIDELGNLYVSDSGNQRIRYINFEQGIVTTVAGGGEYEDNDLYVDGAYQDGLAEEARFSSPAGLFVASDGSLLIADRNNHAIRMLSDGVVYTLAGQAEDSGKHDGVLHAAMMSEPTDVIERADGSIVFTDSSNNKLRVIQHYKQQEHIEDGNVHVFINGELLQTDVAATVRNGRTYVPLRALAEHLGYKVQYDKVSNQTRIEINAELTYIFTDNGSSVIKQSSEGTDMLDAASIDVNNRLLVPVRFVAEQLGFDVQWDQKQKHVVVRSVLFQP